MYKQNDTTRVTSAAKKYMNALWVGDAPRAIDIILASEANIPPFNWEFYVKVYFNYFLHKCMSCLSPRACPLITALT
jgi:hypothetical protein